MLKHRVITAIVLFVIVLGALFGLERKGFAIAAAAFFLAAGWEWTAWIGRLTAVQRGAWLAVLAVLMLAIEAWQWTAVLKWLPWAWLLLIYWVVRYPNGTTLWSKAPVMAVLGLFLLAPTWAAVVHLKDQGALGLNGPWALLFIMLWVWAADTGAYFAGRTFGKNKLAPKVSPGKTVEGLVGGVLLSLLVVQVVAALWVPESVSRFNLLLVALLTIFVSVFGDLFESMIKRYRGVKDSGKILPGHGGMLDRIDSLTAALPIAIAAMSLAGLPGGL
ncbi:MAG TPA: phosphatidate cytidylyltransferase [Alcanivoracaceae bacterium]|nr:phosphatidate cytidylyltransferase [Alcanivoracaceae bacterium]